MSRRFVVGVAFFVGNGRVKSGEKGFLFFEGELVIDTGLCLNVLRRLAATRFDGTPSGLCMCWVGFPTTGML